MLDDDILSSLDKTVNTNLACYYAQVCTDVINEMINAMTLSLPVGAADT